MNSDPVRLAAGVLSACDASVPVILAVSGGSDSMAMLRAFAACGGNRPPLIVATVDHGLRPEAADEAARVGELSAALGLTHKTLVWQSPERATGLQAAARAARHHLLAGFAREQGARMVLLAHTADDQGETIRMRAARSPDPLSPGLSGIAPASLVERDIWFARPFLGLSRSSLRAYLGTLGQDWIDDPSNDNPAFERVRVRQAAEGRAFVQGTGRADLAAKAAVLAEAALSLPLPGLYRLDRELVDVADPASGTLITTLAALAGGATHRPGRDVSAWILAHCATGSGQMAASRAIIEVRKDAFWFYREARNLPAWPDGARDGVWDNRFAVAPAQPVDAAHGNVSDAVPSGVLSRARIGLEPFFADNGPAIAPVLSLWRTVLPSFDWPLAQIIGLKAGLQRLPAVPEPFFTRT